MFNVQTIEITNVDVLSVLFTLLSDKTWPLNDQNPYLHDIHAYIQIYYINMYLTSLIKEEI